MKNTIKILLTGILFCSIAFADGDGSMGNGGKTCTSNCFVENQETETKDSEQKAKDSEQKTSDPSILDLVKDYLISIFG